MMCCFSTVILSLHMFVHSVFLPLEMFSTMMPLNNSSSQKLAQHPNLIQKKKKQTQKPRGNLQKTSHTVCKCGGRIVSLGGLKYWPQSLTPRRGIMRLGSLSQGETAAFAACYPAPSPTGGNSKEEKCFGIVPQIAACVLGCSFSPVCVCKYKMHSGSPSLIP